MSSSDQQYPYDAYDPYTTAGGRPDPQATQTWQGQTWDTHHQPTVQPAVQPIQPERPGHSEQPAQGYEPYQPPEPYEPQPSHQHQMQQAYQGYETHEAYQPVQPTPQHAAADTAYLPPQAYPDQTHSGQAYPGQGYPGQAHSGQAYPGQGYPDQARPAQMYEPQGFPAHSQPLPPEAPAASAAPAATAAPSFDAAGYSAPTTLGNARITDAQRARAEGRSPIIPPGIQPAGLTALLGMLLAGGAALGTYGLLLPLVLLQAVTAAGWFRLNGMWPARQGIALAFAGGLAADAVLLAVGRAHATAAITGTLGVWVLLTLVLQLRSRAAADERVYGLMATVASAALTILAAGHLAAETEAVTIGAIAVAAAVVARALPLPLPGAASVVVSLLAAVAAGAAAGGLAGAAADGALLGFAAGGCALIGLRVASYDYPSRFVHFTAGVALPLAVAAPAVYVLGRALG
ncbi:hypothetical protein QCN29_28795 [Streptomyces sp. HNM0663]|uniref:Integral membrane protein n=1 Tax=Streptomyces chengmaiensis TaxID=3040919 RepID=A0ABT6HVG3_9ACTN|nr:hypothetical protein [Streptomyces chengmaiensis]MDH2392707.1 hypothetical protein [Streptomyces chengmaiensis]